MISTYAQMLAKQISGDAQKAPLLEKIARQTFRASEIVNSLLNFSRTSPTEFVPVELNKVIRETLTLLEHQLSQAAIKVRLQGLEEHYPWIDPAGLDYFRARLHLAPRDAQYALDLVVERCRTFEWQQKAVDALSFKLDMLWVQLDAIDQGDTRPEGART